MKKYRCLIVDKMHESIIPMLKELNVQVDYCPELTRKEIIDRILDYDILFIRSKTQVDEELLTKADKLKIVGRAGAGIDNLDEVYLSNKGISIINASEGNRDAVGEHTIGMLLALLNNVVKAHTQVALKKWDREGNRGVELSEKTVGIIGYGNMGRAFAQRLSGFGCRVLAFDKYLVDYSDEYITEVSLNEIYEQADIVSLHIPLTSETKGWIDDDFISKFSKPFFFLNLARGEVAKLSSIRRAIASGAMRGAALDVLENEKLDELTTGQQEDFTYLTSQPNVILTPHIGGWSFESYKKINKVLTSKLLTLLS